MRKIALGIFISTMVHVGLWFFFEMLTCLGSLKMFAIWDISEMFGNCGDLDLFGKFGDFENVWTFIVFF